MTKYTGEVSIGDLFLVTTAHGTELVEVVWLGYANIVRVKVIFGHDVGLEMYVGTSILEPYTKGE